ncbi:hypothetical protein [Ruminococcus sp.]|uniref:hypothetical protein n=1 Tax=Ruminococcus sp. TaxID=41978 RepID=UPI00204720EA|nr:MAG TPA: hypothetical protein [Caudoviricetes sp.]
MEITEKPIFTEISRKNIDALLYTAMLNEVNRLEKCRNKKERQSIRNFIISAYQTLKTD